MLINVKHLNLEPEYLVNSFLTRMFALMLNQLKTYLMNLFSENGYYVNEKNNSIIPIDQAAGMNLENYSFSQYIPESILNNLENEVQNYKEKAINDFIAENPEWSKREILPFESFLLYDPVLKVVNVNENSIFFEIIEIDENEPFIEPGTILVYDYTKKTGNNKLFFENMKNSLGQIIQPERITYQPEYLTLKIYGKTLYKFYRLKSKILWMNKPGRPEKR